ncbi:RagB/SusD family nutrient uptake outer membrane protein [Reichenbachiella sp. MALMAid0571]|uniref:RagB/SusD family nutrient uptake outer membrane protein n=1 Tax=Reichenbachiella sp. MALMAid0571 TaxID=3143939 RepID=UPI0032E0041D
MKLKKIILILIFPLFVSCENYLEEEPYSFLSEANFPEKAEDGRIALNSAYSVFGGANIVGYAYLCYSIADTDFGSYGASLSNSYGLYQNFTRTSADGFPKSVWADLYKGINICNFVIDVVAEKNFEGGDQLIAEAKGLRAYFYIQVSNQFGDAPLRTKTTNGVGSVNVSRAGVDDIRTLILQDLNEAEAVMENYPSVFAVQNRGGYVTLGAVKMMKAQMHMFMAGWRRSSTGEMVAGDPSHWTSVRDICQEIIDMGIYELDPDYTNVFKDYYLDNYNNESIWEIDFSMPSNGATLPNAMTAPPYGSGSAGGFGNMRTTKGFYDSFDPMDTRRDWSIGQGSFSGYTFVPSAAIYSRPYINKYRKVPGNGDYSYRTPHNNPIYRYAEVHLMLAEALNEINNGPTAQAYTAINTVRYRARSSDHKDDGTVLPDLTGLDYSSFKEAIIDERAFELAFEGQRRMDLIRWGIYLDRLQAFEDDLTGMNKAAKVQGYHMLLPIPLDEFNLNPDWDQNDLW